MTIACTAAPPFEAASLPVPTGRFAPSADNDPAFEALRRPRARFSLEPDRSHLEHVGARLSPLDPIVLQPVVRSDGDRWTGQDAYSRSIARLFNLASAPTATTTTLKTAQLAVSRLVAADPGTGLSSPLPMEKAYIVALHLQDSARNEFWKAGRRSPTDPLAAGSIVIAHLEDEPALNLLDPTDALLIHIPQIVFDELADDHGAPRINALNDPAGAIDPVVHHLARALAPCLEAPQPGAQLFFDHVAFAIHARLATRYGRLQPQTAARGAGLSAWQERVAKEALAADLAREPALAKVASACGLPVSRFVRAFRQTTGAPPFRWLRALRIERARDLLLNSPLALAQIAYDCGFADQSHFTRVFTAAVGITPGAWRRARRA
jgi:AraC family transcriptional regulator